MHAHSSEFYPQLFLPSSDSLLLTRQTINCLIEQAEQAINKSLISTYGVQSTPLAQRCTHPKNDRPRTNQNKETTARPHSKGPSISLSTAANPPLLPRINLICWLWGPRIKIRGFTKQNPTESASGLSPQHKSQLHIWPSSQGNVAKKLKEWVSGSVIPDFLEVMPLLPGWRKRLSSFRIYLSATEARKWQLRNRGSNWPRGTNLLGTANMQLPGAGRGHLRRGWSPLRPYFPTPVPGQAVWVKAEEPRKVTAKECLRVPSSSYHQDKDAAYGDDRNLLPHQISTEITSRYTALYTDI